jgi:hypothetical protein
VLAKRPREALSLTDALRRSTGVRPRTNEASELTATSAQAAHLGSMWGRASARAFARAASLACVLGAATPGCLLASERPHDGESSSSSSGGATTASTTVDSSTSDESSTSDGAEPIPQHCEERCENAARCGGDSYDTCIYFCLDEIDSEPGCVLEFASRNTCVGAIASCSEFAEWSSGDPCSGQYYPCQNQDYYLHECTDYGC